MSNQSRLIAAGFVGVCCVALACGSSTADAVPHPEVCAGPPLRRAELRQAAFEKGYDLDPRYDCVTKQSAAIVDKAPVAPVQEPAAATPGAPAAALATTLREARQAFTTTISHRSERPLPLPTPPSHLFVRTDVSSTVGTLPAFITPDPRDGRRHPAILWLTGGDSNSLDEFWTPGPASHDESASAYRNAGVVMMFPTLRGGNQNPGSHEYLYGEVNDVIAAAEHLSRQPYVDPEQIYLGGHSTGGTLALLTAEMSDRFKAVFAFGPVADADRYSMSSIIPVSLRGPDDRERRLRSPGYWLADITTPTWLIEGRSRPGNIDEVEEMCAATRNPAVHCIRASGVDHFSVLARVNGVIAGRLAIAKDIPFVLREDEFASARPSP
jgi:acetyl esterase/lipase